MQYQEAGAGGAELCRVEGGSGMSMISAGQAEGLHHKHIQHLVLPFVDRATDPSSGSPCSTTRSRSW